MLTSNSKIQNEYKCPSKITFKLPLNDIKINDILIKHELKLPQLRNQIELIDPLLHIEKSLPQNESINSNIKYECNKPLFSVLRYRSRRMNRKKQQAFYKRMSYILEKRKLKKLKRYEKLKDLYKLVFEKKTERFDPERMIKRELEKAKFFGYKVTDEYDKYRQYIKECMQTFEPKFSQKFDGQVNFIHNKRDHSGKLMKLGFDYTKDGKLNVHQPRGKRTKLDAYEKSLLE